MSTNLMFYKKLGVLLLIIAHISLNAMDQQHGNSQLVYESDEAMCCVGLATGFLVGLCTSAVSSVATIISASSCGSLAEVSPVFGSAGVGVSIGLECGFHVGSYCCCCTQRGKTQIKKCFSNPLRYGRNNQS
jgi:hypothetical protein